MRILIADDDLTSRNILTAILQKQGYEIIIACDGKEAWDIMQHPNAPELILLDWMMPKLDGLEVCQKIRSKKSDHPAYVIIVTGRGKKGDIVSGLGAGANDYIAKPFDQEELCARVEVGCRFIKLFNELKQTRDKLKLQALTDPLTGILNRRGVLNVLDKEIVRVQRNEGSLLVALCDIDYFKKVNDIYGHQVGDEVLCGLVQCIEKHLRKYDSLGRFGGEEFLIVSPGENSDNALNMFKRLCLVVSNNKIDTQAGPISITVSIGVTVRKDIDTVDSLIERADAALYEAKKKGRNRVEYNK